MIEGFPKVGDPVISRRFPWAKGKTFFTIWLSSRISMYELTVPTSALQSEAISEKLTSFPAASEACETHLPA